MGGRSGSEQDATAKRRPVRARSVGEQVQPMGQAMR